jgi:3-mercaptopyruvate sulfurtransferase SseA
MIRRPQRASHYGSVALPQGRDGAGLKLDGGDSMNMRINMGWTGACALALVLGLQGCGGEEDTSSTASQITVNTPAAIAQVSADNYDDNVNGLITESTLKRWKDDWPTERATLGLSGKLIILQVTAGPAGAEYIKQDGVNVFTYLSPSSEWIQTRSNGVIETQSMVPEGAAMDALLKKLNIDPKNDMVVVAMGTGTTGNAMGQGRIWYALRYWGMDKKNLAILNGGNQWLDDVLGLPVELLPGDFQATAATQSVVPGNHSVRELLVDNTQLQATMEDLLKVLPSSDTNVKTDGVFIWDARSVGQYSAGEYAELGERSCTTAYCDLDDAADYMWSFQNGGSRQGHPYGTLQLQFTRMLDASKGYAYRAKSELSAMLLGGTNADGVGFVGSDYQLVGQGNAYQEGDTIYGYCETTFRAMITGVVSAVILGKPTRFYDGAMVEWNSLSNMRDSNYNFILPSDSPWRTDLKSFFRPATSYTLVNPRTIIDPYATSASAIIDADRVYKIEQPVGSDTGSGSAPTNPCGG